MWIWLWLLAAQTGGLSGAMPAHPETAALNLYLAGDREGAVARLQTAAGADSRLADLLTGVRELARGHAAEAVAPLQNAVRNDSGNSAARQALADALYQSGHFQLAAVELMRVTDALPANARAWYVLGRTWSALAQNGTRELLAVAPPDSAMGLAAAADGFMERHLYRRALVLYRQALDKDPDLLPVRASAAQIYRLNGRADWAAKEDERIAAADCSDLALACQARGGHYEALLAAVLHGHSTADLYWRIQAYTGLANNAFTKLAALPPSPQLHQYKAGIAHEAGEHAEVVVELRMAVQLAPRDRALRRDLAMALGGDGEYGEAVRMARDLLRNEPDSAELNALAGTALLDDQKAEEAIGYLQKALAAGAAGASLRASLGKALLQTGKPTLALPHLSAAASADQDGSVHFQLARAYQQTGQKELAARAMAEYRKLATKVPFPPEPPLAPPE